MKNSDIILAASFTLVPGVILVLLGFIPFIHTFWAELNSYGSETPGGFSGWFWKAFKYYIIGSMILGILLIMVFNGIVTE